MCLIVLHIDHIITNNSFKNQGRVSMKTKGNWGNKTKDLLIPFFSTKDPMERLSTEEAELLLTQIINNMSLPPASWNVKSLMYCLNDLLYYAVSIEDNFLLDKVCSLTVELLQANPKHFLTEFGKPIEEGKFKGKNSAYFWLDQLYSAVFIAQNEHPVRDIHYVLISVLKKDGDKFSRFLMSPIEGEGSYAGTNGLLVLSRILSHVTQPSYRYVSRFLMADFLRDCFMSSPDVIGKGLCEEITNGSFKGKSSLYMLVDSLKNAAVDDPQIVDIICDIILNINQRNSVSLIETLGKINQSGPYKGKSSLHTILTTLVSSAYLKDNPEIAEHLVNMLLKLWNTEKNQNRLGALLTRPIENNGQNGVMLLVRALTTMIDNHMDSALLVDLLEGVIEANPDELFQALTQEAEDTRRMYNKVSAVQQLIEAMPKHDRLQGIIKKLALSPAAPQLMCSLSEPARSIFIQVFTEVHALSKKEVNVLTQLLLNDRGKIEDYSDTSVFLSQIKAGACTESFFPATPSNSKPSQKDSDDNIQNNSRYPG